MQIQKSLTGTSNTSAKPGAEKKHSDKKDADGRQKKSDSFHKSRDKTKDADKKHQPSFAAVDS